jgi:hypothetical protein
MWEAAPNTKKDVTRNHICYSKWFSHAHHLRNWRPKEWYIDIIASKSNIVDCFNHLYCTYMDFADQTWYVHSYLSWKKRNAWVYVYISYQVGFNLSTTSILLENVRTDCYISLEDKEEKERKVIKTTLEIEPRLPFTSKRLYLRCDV